MKELISLVPGLLTPVFVAYSTNAGEVSTASDKRWGEKALV